MTTKLIFFDACTLLDSIAHDGVGQRSNFDKQRVAKLKEKTNQQVDASKLRGGIIGLLRQGYSPKITLKQYRETLNSFNVEFSKGSCSIENERDIKDLLSAFSTNIVTNKISEEFVETHDYLITHIFENKTKFPYNKLFEKHNKLPSKKNPFTFPEKNKLNKKGLEFAEIWTDLELILIAHEKKSHIYSSDDDFLYFGMILPTLPVPEIINNPNRLLASLLTPEVTVRHSTKYYGSPETIHNLIKTINLKNVK
jgi:hypothetical protein